jgi:hypothetical protein
MTATMDQITPSAPPSDADPHAELAELLAVIRRCPFCRRYVCKVCGRAIGKRAKALLTASNFIVCMTCMNHREMEAHRVCYPDCPWMCHDIYDHGGTYCTQGGLRRLIAEGLPST